MLRLVSDENFNGEIVRGLLRVQEDLNLVRVQDVGLLRADDPPILDARYFSTPQSRRRLFVVCDLLAQPTLPTVTRPTSRSVAGILGRGGPEQSPWDSSPLFGCGIIASGNPVEFS